MKEKKIKQQQTKQKREMRDMESDWRDFKEAMLMTAEKVCD